MHESVSDFGEGRLLERGEERYAVYYGGEDRTETKTARACAYVLMLPEPR